MKALQQRNYREEIGSENPDDNSSDEDTVSDLKQANLNDSKMEKKAQLNNAVKNYFIKQKSSIK